MDNQRIYEWFRFGDNDLIAADHLLATLRPQILEIICYHCQQAVEKYLKGYLVFQGAEEPPKIHNLMALCELCSQSDSKFDGIVAKCNILNAYGVQPRYPDEIYIDAAGNNYQQELPSKFALDKYFIYNYNICCMCLLAGPEQICE